MGAGRARSPLAVGIVGCGVMGRLHLQGYVAAGAEILGVADPDPQRGRELAEAGGCRWYPDHGELFDQPGLRAVSVTTPNYLHRQVCCEALERGLAVLCEKTLAGSPADGQAIVDTVTATRGRFQIGYMKRFHPASAAFRQLVTQLGPVEAGHVTCYQPMHNWSPSPGTWRFTLEQAGGGVLLHGASHTLDLLLWSLQSGPRYIDARIRAHPGAEVEHQANGLLEFELGPTVTFEAGWYPHTATGPLLTGWDESITLRGPAGIAQLTMVNWTRATELSASASLYLEARKTWKHIVPPPVDYFKAELAAFVHNVERGQPVSPNERDGLLVDRVVDAAYRSARTFQRQRLPNDVACQ